MVVHSSCVSKLKATREAQAKLSIANIHALDFDFNTAVNRFKLTAHCMERILITNVLVGPQGYDKYIFPFMPRPHRFLNAPLQRLTF